MREWEKEKEKDKERASQQKRTKNTTHSSDRLLNALTEKCNSRL